MKNITSRILFLFILLLLFPLSMDAKTRKGEKTEPASVTDMLSGLEIPSPALWHQGMPFVFMADRVALSLIPEVPFEATDTVPMYGSCWHYDSMVSEEDWMGQELLQLRFISPDGRAYRYNTGRPFQIVSDTTYHPILTVLYPTELVHRTDSILRARTLYIMYNDERVSYQTDSLSETVTHQKFVPVQVDSVTYGTEIAPLRVFFSRDNGEHGSFLSSLPGSRQNATSTSIDRFLSISDPYLLHPDITPAIWAKIQYSEIQLDMTSEEVRLAWGRPSRIERGASRNGMIEYWYYSNNRILQIWDGRLSKIGVL